MYRATCGRWALFRTIPTSQHCVRYVLLCQCDVIVHQCRSVGLLGSKLHNMG
jgi:hypothetical protein